MNKKQKALARQLYRAYVALNRALELCTADALLSSEDYESLDSACETVEGLHEALNPESK